MAFNLGKHRGIGGKVATKPKNGLTMAGFLELVAGSHLTMDETKIVCIRLMRRCYEWQASGSRSDSKLYRTETNAEAADLKVAP